MEDSEIFIMVSVIGFWLVAGFFYFKDKGYTTIESIYRAPFPFLGMIAIFGVIAVAFIIWDPLGWMALIFLLYNIIKGGGVDPGGIGGSGTNEAI